jgi:hypothetical protein
LFDLNWKILGVAGTEDATGSTTNGASRQRGELSASIEAVCSAAMSNPPELCWSIVAKAHSKIGTGDDKYDGPTTRSTCPFLIFLIAQVGDLPALAILKSN